MELDDVAETRVSGVRVVGGFAELSTLVPQAWRDLAAAGLPQDVVLVELSSRRADGDYEEVLGVVDEDGAGDELRAAAGHLELVTGVFPGGLVVRTEHEGPVEQIAQTFAELMDWAAGRALRPTGELLDSGYRVDGAAERHTLWVRVEQV